MTVATNGLDKETLIAIVQAKKTRWGGGLDMQRL